MGAIYDYLDNIKGAVLKSIGRACNMAWLIFENKSKNEYALHIQGSWRIVDREKDAILFAIGDIFQPKRNIEWTEGFDWDIQGNNLYDEKAKEWIEANNEIYVVDYRLDVLCDIEIFFSNGNVFETFSDNTAPIECWRFFEKDADKHIVVRGEYLTLEG